ncbi:MAG: hypothetical protein E7645_07945 [Ruminococcaceae bacterium]|nr:hypothetical protein [Oscillospiraceae bacterium]
MSEKTIKWRVGDWKQGGYEIEYMVNGIVNCTFIGVPDDRANAFRLRFRSRMPYGEVPKVKSVSFFEVGKDLTR